MKPHLLISDVSVYIFYKSMKRKQLVGFTQILQKNSTPI